MKRSLILTLAGILTTSLLSPSAHAAATSVSCDAVLNQTFSLVGPRTRESQEYMLETHTLSLTPSGARDVTDIYKLHLKYDPAPVGATTGDKITCLGFSIQLGKKPEVQIPSLVGFSYNLDLSPNNGKGTAPVLGIPHGPFENLVDSSGHPVPQGNSYHVYNSFCDFHAFCNVFTEPMNEGNGIEDLTKIGQKVVHATAFSKAPVNVGSNVAAGSFYKNGEVTLEFKGLGLVDHSVCAILTVDSGQSSFNMRMRPVPEMEIKTTGGSRYIGDIYLDLNTKWVSKVVAYEMIVSQTTLPMPPNKINAVGARDILIQNLGNGSASK